MKLSELQSVVKDQEEVLNTFDLGTIRELLGSLPVIQSHALVVSGIRRCGKSVLLHQFIWKEKEDVFFLNFADIRLYGFSAADFRLLDDLIKESRKKILFFDEIQDAEGWELYVRQKLDQSMRIILTSSNARMLSVELGTHLTGRHISRELFPFSFNEFCSFSGLPADSKSYFSYLDKGGFPEYLKTNNIELLSLLIEDIIHRDIAVRYGIREISGLKKLCIYLISNFARPFSPSKLTGTTGVRSASTVLEYLSYLESCYLFNIVPRFSWSLKGQMLSGKKVYVVDNGLIKAASVTASGDLGRKLENSVYWTIRRTTKNIWYYSDGHSECDFIFKTDNAFAAIQVCVELNGDNQEWETAGILSALRFFNLTEGLILTLDQTDKILVENYIIHVVPAYQFDLVRKTDISA
jgi:predicted AAA+ superfamily ATPase